MKAQNTGRSETRGTACRSILKLGLVALLAVAACFGSSAVASAQAVCGFGSNCQTIVTVSTSEELIFNTPTLVTNQAVWFQTELIGKITGGTPLYDQTFTLPFSDPIVQAGVTQARLAITTVGGPGVLTLGPILTSHTVTNTSSSVTTYSFNHAVVAFNVETSVGPGTVLVGTRSTCAASLATLPSTTKPTCSTGGTLGTLAGGQVDVNANTDTTDYIDQATTTTTGTLTSEVYTLTGTIKPFGTVHDAVADAGFAAGDRFARRLLGAGEGGGEALGTSDWRVWEEAYGYNATVGHQGDIPSYSNLTGGLRGGVSFQADDSFQVGAGLDYNGGTLGENTAQEFGNLHLVQFGLNAGWHQGDLFATLAGSYGSATASTQVTPQGISQTALSHYNFHVAAVAGEGGMRFDLGDGLALTPSLGAAYYNIDQGGFTETGSLLALTAASHSFERSKEWLGLSGQTDIVAGGTTLTLNAYGRAAFWNGDTTIALPAAFVGSTTMLSLAGSSTGTWGGEAGVSLGWHAFSTVSFYAGYDAEFHARSALQTLSVGLNIAL